VGRAFDVEEPTAHRQRRVEHDLDLVVDRETLHVRVDGVDDVGQVVDAFTVLGKGLRVGTAVAGRAKSPRQLS
jgi:hypothetical protein